MAFDFGTIMQLKKLLKILYVLFFIQAATVGRAQDGKSKNIQTINNKKYYIHKVEKGQSIYAISKIYGAELNSIFIENPDAIDGIKTGQELKIPFAKEIVPATSSKDFDNFILHKVSKSETVYGICKKYSITEQKFTELNPEAKQGLKEGQLVKVGLKEKTQVTAPVVVATATVSAVDSNYNYHTVEQGETVYAITKKYAISNDELFRLNPEIASGIKAGQKLKVGTKNKSVDPVVTNTVVPVSVDTTRIDKPKKQSY